jgi:hypothetical protein
MGDISNSWKNERGEILVRRSLMHIIPSFDTQ